jgi:hypothetical protein
MENPEPDQLTITITPDTLYDCERAVLTTLDYCATCVVAMAMNRQHPRSIEWRVNSRNVYHNRGVGLSYRLGEDGKRIVDLFDEGKLEASMLPITLTFDRC